VRPDTGKLKKVLVAAVASWSSGKLRFWFNHCWLFQQQSRAKNIGFFANDRLFSASYLLHLYRSGTMRLISFFRVLLCRLLSLSAW
jgi:hypothetical protein